MADLIISTRMHIPEREFEFSFVRSSGPGGQNVNKVNSKAVLRWNFRESPSVPEAVKERFLQAFATKINESGEVILTSDSFRDQLRNREDCLEKLAVMLRAVEHPPKKRKKTKPTYSSKLKRLDSKRRQSEKKKSRA